MRYRTPEAFRAGLDQRLKNEAATGHVALMRLRKRVAFERFLARLCATAPTGWVLEGAFALELLLGLRSRATKDIDLARVDDEEAATEHLQRAAAFDLDDFFSFEVRRTPALDGVGGVRAVRYTGGPSSRGAVSNTSRSTWHLMRSHRVKPSGCGRRTCWRSPRSRRPTFPWSRSNSTSRRSSTPTPVPMASADGKAPVPRLVDLVLISDLAETDAERLAQALASTFGRRARQPLPDVVPPPPRSWARPYVALAREVGLAQDLDDGHAAVAAWLDPILASKTAGTWDPQAKRWR